MFADGTQNMATFNAKSFEKKLKTLDPTQTGIQTLSLWILHHRQHGKPITDIWSNQVTKVEKVDKRLSLFYLANDVVQNGKRKAKDLVILFGKAFAEVMPLLGDTKIKGQVERVFDIWVERGIYEVNLVNKYREFLHRKSTIEKEKEKIKPAEPVISRKVVPPDFKVAKLLVSIKKTTSLDNEVMRKSKLLDNLSIDASSFDSVKHVKGRSSVGKFYKQFDESKVVLDDYCHLLRRCVKDKTSLAAGLSTGETYYDAAQEEAKVIVNAYKTFGNRLKSMKKKLETKISRMESSESPRDDSQPSNIEPISSADNTPNDNNETIIQDMDLDSNSGDETSLNAYNPDTAPLHQLSSSDAAHGSETDSTTLNQITGTNDTFQQNINKDNLSQKGTTASTENSNQNSSTENVPLDKNPVKKSTPFFETSVTKSIPFHEKNIPSAVPFFDNTVGENTSLLRLTHSENDPFHRASSTPAKNMAPFLNFELLNGMTSFLDQSDAKPMLELSVDTTDVMQCPPDDTSKAMSLATTPISPAVPTAGEIVVNDVQAINEDNVESLQTIVTTNSVFGFMPPVYKPSDSNNLALTSSGNNLTPSTPVLDEIGSKNHVVGNPENKPLQNLIDSLFPMLSKSLQTIKEKTAVPEPPKEEPSINDAIAFALGGDEDVPCKKGRFVPVSPDPIPVTSPLSLTNPQGLSENQAELINIAAGITKLDDNFQPVTTSSTNYHAVTTVSNFLPVTTISEAIPTDVNAIPKSVAEIPLSVKSKTRDDDDKSEKSDKRKSSSSRNGGGGERSSSKRSHRRSSSRSPNRKSKDSKSRDSSPGRRSSHHKSSSRDYRDDRHYDRKRSSRRSPSPRNRRKSSSNSSKDKDKGDKRKHSPASKPYYNDRRSPTPEMDSSRASFPGAGQFDRHTQNQPAFVTSTSGDTLVNSSNNQIDNPTQQLKVLNNHIPQNMPVPDMNLFLQLVKLRPGVTMNPLQAPPMGLQAPTSTLTLDMSGRPMLTPGVSLQPLEPMQTMIPIEIRPPNIQNNNLITLGGDDTSLTAKNSVYNPLKELSESKPDQIFDSHNEKVNEFPVDKPPPFPGPPPSFPGSPPHFSDSNLPSFDILPGNIDLPPPNIRVPPFQPPRQNFQRPQRPYFERSPRHKFERPTRGPPRSNFDRPPRPDFDRNFDRPPRPRLNFDEEDDYKPRCAEPDPLLEEMEKKDPRFNSTPRFLHRPRFPNNNAPIFRPRYNNRRGPPLFRPRLPFYGGPML